MNKRTLREYRIWKSMKARCSAPSQTKGNYQRLKISVCQRWKDSFVAFMEDMGPLPSQLHSIDRIDNTKGYYPENCRWILQSEQSKNRLTNKYFTYNGKTMILKDWARHTGIKYETLWKRLYRQNLSFVEALSYKR